MILVIKGQQEKLALYLPYLLLDKFECRTLVHRLLCVHYCREASVGRQSSAGQVQSLSQHRHSPPTATGEMALPKISFKKVLKL